MIKGNRPLGTILFFSVTLGAFWFLSPKEPPKTAPFAEAKVSLPSGENDERAAIRAPGSVRPTPRISVAKLSANEPLKPHWKKRVEEALLVQGGGNLKSATVEKVDAFDWQIGKVKVPVESVLVKLEHIQGHRSSFRAIVDASNGKILQTWDHPVIDDFGHNSNHIKVDPRYHND